ncbi:eaf79629-f9d0-4eae-acb4-d01646bffcc6-CDS [Sclerotinia trifoliorum]|uniref:Eaf79629-f9d0-4eae-acb4-d01646bffcc6-CDS n=1 Tax=Sclerotinia trifoliorum TaxID=28548 RepID=A0A8H2VZW3_9HELO|nr:eaf79629-f9d0-4eae-acb4-d01646bffcc6-CDS [Sclerotinia trifoliorum]
MPPSPPWKTSERTYFLNFMDEFVAEGGFRNPIRADDWLRALRTMNMEQVRHHLGGALHKQDPWPIRTYTIWSLLAVWRKAKKDRKAAAREIPDQITQENEPEGEYFLNAVENEPNDSILDSPLVEDFEAALPEEWEREFEERLALLKREWAQEAAAQEAATQNAFRNLLYIAPEETILPLSEEEGASQLIAILEEPADRHSLMEASRELLARMDADLTVQEDFWAAFEKRFGSE